MARLEQPPGVRACRKGGDWVVARSSEGAMYLMKELAQLEHLLGPHVRALVKAELLDLMRGAERGELRYAEYPDAGEVELMRAAPDVLELKLSDATGEDDDERFHLRVFFSEPDVMPGKLVALMLMWKRPGEVDLEMQSALAKAASRRLTEYLRREGL